MLILCSVNIFPCYFIQLTFFPATVKKTTVANTNKSTK